MSLQIKQIHKTAEQINEILDLASNSCPSIGDLDDLATSEKSTLVAAINSVEEKTKDTFIFPTFEIENGHLIAYAPDNASLFAAEINEQGHLILNITL